MDKLAMKYLFFKLYSEYRSLIYLRLLHKDATGMIINHNPACQRKP